MQNVELLGFRNRIPIAEAIEPCFLRASSSRAKRLKTKCVAQKPRTDQQARRKRSWTRCPPHTSELSNGGPDKSIAVCCRWPVLVEPEARRAWKTRSWSIAFSVSIRASSTRSSAAVTVPTPVRAD